MSINLKEILKQWNINIPDDIGIAEYLCENKKTNCFYIDKLPLAVSKENCEKFDQVDIFFQEVLEGTVLKEEFLKTELKYRNTLTKLWLYNRIFVQISAQYANQEMMEKAIDFQYKKYLPEFQSISDANNTVELFEKEQLEFWVQVGIRDIASTVLYCEDYQLLIVPSWSCFIIYFKDLANHQIVKDIVLSEGLFLRQHY